MAEYLYVEPWAHELPFFVRVPAGALDRGAYEVVDSAGVGKGEWLDAVTLRREGRRISRAVLSETTGLVPV